MLPKYFAKEDLELLDSAAVAPETEEDEETSRLPRADSNAKVDARMYRNGKPVDE